MAKFAQSGSSHNTERLSKGKVGTQMSGMHSQKASTAEIRSVAKAARRDNATPRRRERGQ